MSVKISPKHGVNPSMGICFFCGEETGEIAILGKLPNDQEAPKYAILNYEPCTKCREQFEQGIAFIGVVDHVDDDRPEIAQNAYPTGSVLVLTRDAVEKADFINNKSKEHILEVGHALIPEEILKKLRPTTE